MIVGIRTPAGDARLAEAERQLGFAIPAAYRAFLQASDGGRPRQGWFSSRVGVTDFLGVDAVIAEQRARRGRVPADLLPIAHAEGGNLVCIALEAKEPGAIYFWDHQREHLGPEQAVERIAGSFDEFASQLREPPRPREPAQGVHVHSNPKFRQWVMEQEALEAQRPTLSWPPKE
jgi:hypothetical protein